MDRDPKNRECTRDPIFLLQAGYRQWTQIYDWLEADGDSMWIKNGEEPEDWIKPFLDEDGSIVYSAEFWKVAESLENDHGWPLVYIEWRTESVFLTRDEAEAWAKRREYNYEKWRVYCIPCDGELARILRELQVPAA